MYYIMPQRINMCLTMTNNKAINKSINKSINKANISSTPPQPSQPSQPSQPINTNRPRVNISRFNMNSVFVSKGRSGG